MNFNPSTTTDAQRQAYISLSRHPWISPEMVKSWTVDQTRQALAWDEADRTNPLDAIMPTWLDALRSDPPRPEEFGNQSPGIGPAADHVRDFGQVVESMVNRPGSAPESAQEHARPRRDDPARQAATYARVANLVKDIPERAPSAREVRGRLQAAIVGAWLTKNAPDFDYVSREEADGDGASFYEDGDDELVLMPDGDVGIYVPPLRVFIIVD